VKRLFQIIAVLIPVLILQTSTAADASAAWNQYCSQYSFASYPQTPTTTFSQAYLGSDFEHDFAEIKSAVNSSVMASGPPASGDDLLNQSLLDW
jgi:hypothetical protein